MKTRILVLLVLLVLMTGCASVYNPSSEPAAEGYSLALDKQVAKAIYDDTYPGSYLDSGLYPWWSVDFFYLGYHPYSYSRFSFYSPYFYPPHHRNFNDWYGGHFIWHDPYLRHHYRGLSRDGVRHDGRRHTGSAPHRLVNPARRTGTGRRSTAVSAGAPRPGAGRMAERRSSADMARHRATGNRGQRKRDRD